MFLFVFELNPWTRIAAFICLLCESDLFEALLKERREQGRDEFQLFALESVKQRYGCKETVWKGSKERDKCMSVFL